MPSLAEVAALLGAELVDAQDPAAEVTGLAPLDQAGPGAVSFIANKKYESALTDCAALAVICTPELAKNPHSTALIVHDNPYLAFARLLATLNPPPRQAPGVHASAVVAPDAELGEGVSVGPNVSIGAGAKVGARTILKPGVVLGPGAEVGEDSLLYANVSIYHGCKIGARCILHSGCVVGSDGFGFATDTTRGVHEKIPQVGIVVVEDDVEIGANSAIDRAVMGETRIGAGTKIDNLVQIAHNVQVGRGCFLVAQVGIAGSTSLGNFVTLAGQVGLAGHLKIGDMVQVGAQSGVGRDVPAGTKMLGSPATLGSDMKRIYATRLRLPKMRQELRELRRQMAAIEARLGGADSASAE